MSNDELSKQIEKHLSSIDIEEGTNLPLYIGVVWGIFCMLVLSAILVAIVAVV